MICHKIIRLIKVCLCYDGKVRDVWFGKFDIYRNQIFLKWLIIGLASPVDGHYVNYYISKRGDKGKATLQLDQMRLE
jgi:hypothetical protein